MTFAQYGDSQTHGGWLEVRSFPAATSVPVGGLLAAATDVAGMRVDVTNRFRIALNTRCPRQSCAGTRFRHFRRTRNPRSALFSCLHHQVGNAPRLISSLQCYRYRFLQTLSIMAASETSGRDLIAALSPNIRSMAQRQKHQRSSY